MERFVILAGLVLCLAAAPNPGSSGPAVRVFSGATLIDGRGGAPIRDAAIVVREGRIEKVGRRGSISLPAGAEIIDLTGRTVIPGIINTHGHVGETKGLDFNAANATRRNVLAQLELYARYGVTTVFSLGGDHKPSFDLRDEQDDPGLSRARIYVAGPVLAPADPEDARRQVREVAALKADLVKIRVDDNLGTTKKMSEPVYRAVIDEAHRRGLRVAAHIFYLEDAKALLRAGADYIAHSVRDRDVDDELIDLLKRRDVCLCPTLTREVSTFVYGSKPDFFSDPFFSRHADPDVVAQLLEPGRQQAMRESRSAQAYRQALDVASRNLKTLAGRGVRIAFGTDSGMPARFQGYFEHLEMELMAKAGLTTRQILASATSDAVRCMKKDARIGTLESGKWADLMVLSADPLTDIKNTRAIHSVWIAGNPVSGTR